MRYFCNTDNKYHNTTIIIIDENSDIVDFYPQRCWGKLKCDWIQFYESHKSIADVFITFEICEGQYKKFVSKGIIPTNYDW